MSTFRIIFLFAIMFSIHLYAQNKINESSQIKQEITEIFSPRICGESYARPTLVLVGGFPGSGKTTLIKALQNAFGSAVISLDAIRQALLDRNVGINEGSFDWEIVRDVYQNLLRKGLQSRLNIIMDSNAHSAQIKTIEVFLQEAGVDQIYQVVKICLNSSYETLLKRVQGREQKPEVQQGTVQDLQHSIDSKKIDPKNYDLVIDTEKLSFEEEWGIVNSFMKPYFDGCRPGPAH